MNAKQTPLYWKIYERGSKSLIETERPIKYNETLLNASPGTIEIAPDPSRLRSKGRSTQDSLSHKLAFISQALIRIVPWWENPGAVCGLGNKGQDDVPELTRAGRPRTGAQRLSHVIGNWIGCSELEVECNYLRKQNPIEFSLGSKRSFIILWGVTQTSVLSLDGLEHPVCSRILATWCKQISIISLSSSWDSYHWLHFMRWHWQYSSHGQQQTVESVHPWCRVWRRLAWLVLLIIRSSGWCPAGRSVAMQNPNSQTT